MITKIEYYKILGLPENASHEEIKKTYRKLAKSLHPDKNNDPKANEQFLKITEAYKYLISDHSFTEEYANYDDIFYRERVREQARQYAQMKYETFKKTEFYKKSQAAITFVNYINSIFFIGVMLCPLWAYLLGGTKGFYTGLVVILLFTPRFVSLIKNGELQLSFKELFNAIKILMVTKVLRLIIISGFNIFLLFDLRSTLKLQLLL